MVILVTVTFVVKANEAQTTGNSEKPLVKQRNTEVEADGSDDSPEILITAHRTVVPLFSYRRLQAQRLSNRKRN